MRILVTGGAGFIGSHFVKRLLRAGEDVVVLDKLTYSGNRANLPDGVELQQGDIAEPEDVARAARGCDAIVNFAAETHVDRSILSAEEFGRTEFRGTQVLLEHLRESGQRLVQVSTDEVYGDLESGGSSRETDPLRPSSPYSAAKAAGDLLISAYVRTFGVSASITRGSNTYGPNQYPEKFIPLFVTNALDGEALPLYGDGRQVRDWLYVEDHCAGIELVLREGAARRDLQRRRRRRAREPRGGAAADRADRRRSLAPAQGRGPARPRPPLLARHGEARVARLAAGDGIRGRAGGDGGVVPREPALVGADQVRQLPRVLRAPVRPAPGRPPAPSRNPPPGGEIP